MREKLVEILDLDVFVSDIMADRILAEFRCDKCKYWRRLDYRCSVKSGAWSPDEFCSLWEAK